MTFDPELITERELEPVGMFQSFEQWFWLAFCRLRNDYCTFRIDRFSKLQVTDISYSTAEHPYLESYLARVSRERKLHQIVLEVPDRSMKYLVNSKYNNGYVSEKRIGEVTEMTFMNSSIEGFVKWIIALGDIVVVKQPEVLKNRLDQLLGKIKNMQG